MDIKFDKDPLPVDQNNFLIKIVNVWIVYDLDAWSRNPTSIFKFKNWLFGATSIVKKRIKKSMFVVAMEENLIVQVHGV